MLHAYLYNDTYQRQEYNNNNRRSQSINPIAGL